MNLSFAQNGLARVPYQLYNYHYTGTENLIANFDSVNSYTQPGSDNGNNRRGLSPAFLQYLTQVLSSKKVQFPGATTDNPVVSLPEALEVIECEPGLFHTNDFRCDTCGLGTYSPDYGFR